MTRDFLPFVYAALIIAAVFSIVMAASTASTIESEMRCVPGTTLQADGSCLPQE